jgi:DNA repair exonuclease SbcCD ATPase subunit
MRIKEIAISGFGGIADEVSIDLNADVVIIVGANGYGKTTVCNAISWVLSGKSPGTQGPRNLYSKSGTTTVELLTDFDGQDVTIARSLENPDETDPKKLRWPLRVRTAEEVLQGAEAEVWLRHHLAGTETSEDFDTLAESFVDSIYLKQESLREFLTGRQDTERFDAVASMVGAGRLREFADKLQSHKRAWVRAANQSDAALGNDRGKVEDLVSSLAVLDAEITRASTPEVKSRWSSWIKDVKSLELSELSEIGDWELTEQTLSSVRGALNRDRSDVEHNESVLIATQAELLIPLPALPNETDSVAVATQIAEASEAKIAAENEVQALRTTLTKAETVLRQAESLREDLASMAAILLRHVSNNCSACGQSVQQHEYRARLESFAADSQDAELRMSVSVQREQLEDAERRSREAATLLTALNDHQRVLQEKRASALAAQEHRKNRLSQVLATLPDDNSVRSPAPTSQGDRIDRQLQYLSERRAWITRATEEGRQFEAIASLEASRSRRTRISAEIAELRNSLKEKEEEIATRRRTDDLATTLLEAVKMDAESFVAGRLTQLRPLLNQFYAAIDPHPTFRSVEIATRRFAGKHRLTPVLRDEDLNVDVTDPGETLSTSQANALAVSLFLSFNLGFAPTHVSALVLDDPLQNLDDVHLLGLVDLLRKILPFRQLIVTTHDHAFAALLARKLRPVTPSARTTYVRFTKWDRDGPGVEQWDVPAEIHPLKLVSASIDAMASTDGAQ